jgi:hypothetical protein
MVTIEDLHNGLIINCSAKFKFKEENLYEIDNLKLGILYNSWYNKTYDGYSAEKILENLNIGVWSIHSEQNKVIEVW